MHGLLLLLLIICFVFIVVFLFCFASGRVFFFGADLSIVSFVICDLCFPSVSDSVSVHIYKRK